MKLILLCLVFVIMLVGCNKTEQIDVNTSKQAEDLNEQQNINEIQQKKLKNLDITVGYEENGELKIIPFTKGSYYESMEYDANKHKIIADNEEVENLIKEYDSIIQNMEIDMEYTNLSIHNTLLWNWIELKSNLNKEEKSIHISYQIIFNRGGEIDDTYELAKILMEYNVTYNKGDIELDDIQIKEQIVMDFIDDINNRYDLCIEEKYADKVIEAYRKGPIKHKNGYTQPYIMMTEYSNNSIELILTSDDNVYNVAMSMHLVYNSSRRTN